MNKYICVDDNNADKYGYVWKANNYRPFEPASGGKKGGLMCFFSHQLGLHAHGSSIYQVQTNGPIIASSKSIRCEEINIISGGIKITEFEHLNPNAYNGALLFYALKYPDLLEKLLPNANLKHRNSTILIKAIKGGYFDSAKLLIDAGVDINAKNNYALRRIEKLGLQDLIYTKV